MPRQYRKIRKKGHVLQQAEYAFTIFAFLSIIGALSFLYYYVFGERSAGFGEVNGPRLFVSISIYAVGLWLSIYRIDRIKKVLTSNLLLLPVFFLPIISIFWSVNPNITLFRSIAYLLTCSFCLYLITSLSPEEFLRRLMVATFIGGLLSFYWVAVNPGNAIHHGGPLSGAWKGVYGHKNELGRIASIAIVASYFVAPGAKWQVYMRWSNIAIYAVLLILSDSKTNWLILFSMGGFIPLTNWLRKAKASPGLRIGLVAGLATAMSALVLTNADKILGAMGRDDSFSGRGTIWHGVSAIIAAKFPLLGAGYGAFFTDAGGVWELKEYLRYWTSLPNHAHNGYLNTQADLGYPGLVILVSFLISLGFRAVLKMITEPERDVWAGLAALFFLFLINNVSESNAFVHSDISWMMMIVSYGYMLPRPVLKTSNRKHRRFRFKSWGLART